MALALSALGLLALFVLTAGQGPAQVNDTRAAALASWSAGVRGDAFLPAEWPASHTYWGVEVGDGRVVVNRFPGVAYWAAPFYALHDTLARPDLPAHPFLVDLRPAAWAAAVTTTAAVLVFFALMRREIGRRWAAASAFVLGLGTGLWSVAADALWPHGPAALLLLSVLYGYRTGRPALIAVSAAACVLVRPHLSIALVGLAAWWIYDDRRWRTVGTSALVGTVTGLLATAAYTWVVFGTGTPTAGYAAESHLDGLAFNPPFQTLTSVGKALVSRDRGVLIYSPVLAVAGTALLHGRRQLPRWTAVSAGAGFVYLIVHVRAVGHAGGEHFFGSRVTLETVVLMAPALAIATKRLASSSQRFRWALMPAVIASFTIQGFGASVRSLDPGEVAKWDEVHEAVDNEFGDLELGDVDLRRRPGEP